MKWNDKKIIKNKNEMFSTFNIFIIITCYYYKNIECRKQGVEIEYIFKL